MSRIVSVWLRAWPIARLLSAQASGALADPVDPRRPLVLVAPGAGGPRVVARNRAAQKGGLVDGELVSNARSKVLDLQTRAADPAADAAALRKLALWCLRYTPIVMPWEEDSGADGLFLDITGSAHLFGGEAQVLADLAQRLGGFGLVPRFGIADTAGTAWAVARFGPGSIVPSGEERRALCNLPLAGLRLHPAASTLLRRLGFRRIGELIDQPRAPFAARFEAELLLRLDQALGRAPEPLTPVVPLSIYRAEATFVEPIMSEEHVLEAATRLLHRLASDLARDAAGARVLRLLLFGIDGGVVNLDVGLAAPSRDAEHIASLFALRLDRLSGALDTDFGFEAAAMHVITAEPLPERQARLGMSADAAPDALAQLIDRLQQRLGHGAVQSLHPHQSHIPERAVRSLPASAGAGEWETAPLPAPRPMLLLPQPEAAEVMALIPDGPPRRFRWRGVVHQVTQTQGPERITPEWWRRTGEPERDYYMVEDAAGRRFWLYRAGIYERSGPSPPQWFVHGVFA